MKKFVIAFILFVVIVIAGMYGVLFTDFGNNLLKPKVQSKIHKYLSEDFSLDTFKLRPSSFAVIMKSRSGSEINIKGLFGIFSNNINAHYYIRLSKNDSIHIKKQTIKGPFWVKGKIIGNVKSKLNIDGKSNIANSKTEYAFTLKKMSFASFSLNAVNVHISKLLETVNRPAYVEGIANIKSDLDDISDDDDISGIVFVNVPKAVLNKVLIKKDFGFELQGSSEIGLELNSNIKGKKAYSKIKVSSIYGSLLCKNAVIKLKNMSLKSDYVLDIPNLDKLYFLTKRHLKGSVVLNGSIKYKKDSAEITAHSNIWGGKLDAVFKNGQIRGKANGIDIVGLTDMLMYKRFFSSKGSLEFNYNIFSKKGAASGTFLNGHILPNRMVLLVKSVAGFDLTKEIYKKTTINSKIDNKKVVLNFDMASRLTNLSTKGARLNFETDKVDALVSATIKKNTMKITIKGDMNKPKIGIDIKKTIKKNIEKKVKKEIKGLIKGIFK